VAARDKLSKLEAKIDHDFQVWTFYRILFRFGFPL
jgi:hypothetical protein